MSSIKRAIRKFHVQVGRAVMAKKCTKKGNARAELLFLLISLLIFEVVDAVAVVVAKALYLPRRNVYLVFYGTKLIIMGSEWKGLINNCRQKHKFLFKASEQFQLKLVVVKSVSRFF